MREKSDAHPFVGSNDTDSIAEHHIHSLQLSRFKSNLGLFHNSPLNILGS